MTFNLLRTHTHSTPLLPPHSSSPLLFSFVVSLVCLLLVNLAVTCITCLLNNLLLSYFFLLSLSLSLSLPQRSGNMFKQVEELEYSVRRLEDEKSILKQENASLVSTVTHSFSHSHTLNLDSHSHAFVLILCSHSHTLTPMYTHALIFILLFSYFHTHTFVLWFHSVRS